MKPSDKVTFELVLINYRVAKIINFIFLQQNSRFRTLEPFVRIFSRPLSLGAILGGFMAFFGGSRIFLKFLNLLEVFGSAEGVMS